MRLPRGFLFVRWVSACSVLLLVTLSEASVRGEGSPGRRPRSVPSETRVLYHGSRSQRRVALTFDACPGRMSIYDHAVIEVLERMQTPATLFLSGLWMERFPEATRELAQNPLFEIALHGHRHRNWLKTSNSGLVEELSAPQDLLLRLTGHLATLVRAPFGWLDERAARVAHEHGLLPVQFDLPSGDPDPRISPPRLRAGVIQGVRNGSIVVFHMNGKGHHTAEILTEVILGLRAKNFELVTVGTLLQSDPGKGLAELPKGLHSPP